MYAAVSEHCLFHLYSSYLHAYEDGTGCSETLAYKIQTSGSYPEESIQEDNYRIISLKKRIGIVVEALVYSPLKPCGHLGGKRRFELEDDGTEQPGVA